MADKLCKWEIGACSETGYVRKENEDRISSIRIGANRLYLVVDGMGGHKAGALAAELTIQGLESGMTKLLPDLPVREAIAGAFSTANQTVYEQAHSEDEATAEMGATAVMLLTQGSLAYVAHVGDSRAYLFTKGKLKRLTKDHSPMERMVAAGILTPAEARAHPQANVIDRAMGNKPQIDVDITEPITLQYGDGVLLCSDGLNGYVDDSIIEATLRHSPKAQEAVSRLVQEALNAGGEDNVSVQFIRLREPNGKTKYIGFASWIKNLFQFKAGMAFLLASLAVCGFVTLLITQPTLTTNVSETDITTHGDIDKKSQQRAVVPSQSSVEFINNTYGTSRYDFFKINFDSLGQEPKDMQIEALSIEVQKLKNEMGKMKSIVGNLKRKPTINPKHKLVVSTDKQKISDNVAQNKKMISPIRTH